MSQYWHRIERRDARGAVLDWVEVGQCARCGRGVDRAFPPEYREVGGALYCRACVPRLVAAPAAASDAAMADELGPLAPADRL